MKNLLKSTLMAASVALLTPLGTAHAALDGYEVIAVETAVDATASKQLTAYCPEGKKALSAGWSVLDDTSAILEGAATYSEPSWDGASWMVNAKNLSTFASTWKLRVRIVCATQ